MANPPQPQNPRVVYPDGTTIPIRRMWYGALINQTHVWVSDAPQFVPWALGVHVKYDHPDGNESHFVLVGYDVKE